MRTIREFFLFFMLINQLQINAMYTTEYRVYKIYAIVKQLLQKNKNIKKLDLKEPDFKGRFKPHECNIIGESSYYLMSHGDFSIYMESPIGGSSIASGKVECEFLTFKFDDSPIKLIRTQSSSDYGNDSIEYSVDLYPEDIASHMLTFKKKYVARLVKLLSQGEKLDSSQSYGPFPVDLATVIAKHRYNVN